MRNVLQSTTRNAFSNYVTLSKSIVLIVKLVEVVAMKVDVVYYEILT